MQRDVYLHKRNIVCINFSEKNIKACLYGCELSVEGVTRYASNSPSIENYRFLGVAQQGNSLWRVLDSRRGGTSPN